MSTLIKNGTIVTADRTYKADVLIEGESITAIGHDLKGDHVIDASGCYIMPGGIDPHTHLDMPFMGTNSADDYESGTKAALSGGTTMVVDFCIPGNGQRLMDAWKDWDVRASKAAADYSYHMCITYWNDQVRQDMADVVNKGVTTFKHFMAYKGALMVNDDEMFSSFQRCAELGAMPLVHAENGDVVAALQKKLLAAESQVRKVTLIHVRRKWKAKQQIARLCWRMLPVCHFTLFTHHLSPRMKRSNAPVRSASASMANRSSSISCSMKANI